MAINTKNRSELKAYFVKNAIPTEANFAELVDAQLNQADDGVFKLGDDPLSVVAAPGAQKRVLRLYEQYPAANPSWTLSLMPRTDVGDANTAAKGLGFDAPDGTNRLFLDTSGKLGLGTTKPSDKLTVRGGDVRIEGGNYRRLKIISDTYWAGIEIVARKVDGKGGNPHIDFTHGNLDNPNFGLRLRATDNDRLLLEAGSGAAKTKFGIGINPQQALHVNGNAVISGSINGASLAVATLNATTKASIKDLSVTNNATVTKNLTVSNNLAVAKALSVGANATVGNNLTVTKALTVGANAAVGNNLAVTKALTVGTNATVSNNLTVTKALAVGTNLAVTGVLTVAGASTLSGQISAPAGIIIGSGSRSSHLNNDGAFYRKSGQAWITVDDHFYIRDNSASGDNWAAHFNTDSGGLGLAGNLNVKGGTISIGGWKLVADGDHLYFKKGSLTIARFSTTHDRVQFYKDRNAKAPYFYYNKNGDRGTYNG